MVAYNELYASGCNMATTRFDSTTSWISKSSLCSILHSSRILCLNLVNALIVELLDIFSL